MPNRVPVVAIRVRLALLAVGLLIALTSPGTAHASPQRIVNPGDPGSSQYQEDVPSAFGNVPATSVAGKPAHGAPLPPGVAVRLAHAGSAGRATARLAVAGTPQSTTTSGRQRHRSSPSSESGAGGGSSGGSGGSGESGGEPSTITQAGSGKGIASSLVTALVGSDGGVGLLLPLLLALSVLLGAGIVARRRRGS